ncbi:MAG: hypothetical protein AAF065_01700 [Verrucomicrobiota bacterium]
MFLKFVCIVSDEVIVFLLVLAAIAPAIKALTPGLPEAVLVSKFHSVSLSNPESTAPSQLTI